MSEQKVFVGVIGLRIILDLGIDVSGAGTAKINYVKPNGTSGQWTATVDPVGNVDGLIYYDTTAGNIDVAGTWKLNGVWDPDGGNIFYGATACLRVWSLGECSS